MGELKKTIGIETKRLEEVHNGTVAEYLFALNSQISVKFSKKFFGLAKARLQKLFEKLCLEILKFMSKGSFSNRPIKKNKKLEKILKDEPRFRIKQARESLFNFGKNGWDEAYNLPLVLRKKLEDELPWISAKEKKLRISGKDFTKKALLELYGGCLIETVLMKNTKGNFTACISTQVGCAMGCKFCSTGAMGFERNLRKEEIVDQYRFWMRRLIENNEDAKISNIVFMGMGEPFLNYGNVRDAVNEILAYTGIGSNHIVISTIGIMDKLNYLLEDELWPNVRLAISLHSAINETRKKIIPPHQNGFYDELIQWAKKYQAKLGTRNRYLSFEYVLMAGINDTKKEAKALIEFLSKIGHIKVNLILYNPPAKKGENRLNVSLNKHIAEFQNLIKDAGFLCTIRKSYGNDISGACGQLLV